MKEPVPINGIQIIVAGARIAGNLRDGGHLRLIARDRVAAPHDTEPGQIDVLPTKIAGREQLPLGRDKTGQRAGHA